MSCTKDTTLPQRHGMTANDAQFAQRGSGQCHQAELHEQLNLCMPMQLRFHRIERGECIMHDAGNGVFNRDDGKIRIAHERATQCILEGLVGDRGGAVRPVLLDRQLTERPEYTLKCNSGNVSAITRLAVV